MPRNSQGLYTLPLPSVRAGELVESDWANQTLDDLAQAMTGSLPRNGSAPMAGPLTLSADPITAPRQAASKEYVDQFIAYATGMFVGAYAFAPLTTEPPGWLLCDGRAVSRTVYAKLFAAIGTSFGAGDGSTTFNLPPQQSRYLRGRGDGEVLNALMDGMFAAHIHNMNDPGHNHWASQAAHSHTTVPHSHGVNDPGHNHTTQAGDINIGSNWGLHPSQNLVGPVSGGTSGTGISIQNAAPATDSQQPAVSTAAALTGQSVAAAGGVENRPASIVCNLFIKAKKDSSGPVPITGLSSSDPACISINMSNPVTPELLLHTNVGYGLVKLDQNAKLPVAQLPAGVQTFLGTFDASGGQNPSEKYPSTTFSDGMTYLISASGTISVFNPNTNVSAPVAVKLGWNLVYLKNATQPVGWYYIEAPVVTAAIASQVAFTPEGTISATNVQAAIAELDNEKVAKSGDTMTGVLTAPSFHAGGDGTTTPGVGVSAGSIEIYGNPAPFIDLKRTAVDYQWRMSIEGDDNFIIIHNSGANATFAPSGGGALSLLASGGYTGKRGSAAGATLGNVNNWWWNGAGGQEMWIDNSFIGTVNVTPSDRRIKQEIAPLLEGALTEVMSWKPVSYRHADVEVWKPGRQILGFIADEVQAVSPLCVIGDPDALTEHGSILTQQLDTTGMLAVLTKAVQELKNEVDSLRSQLAGRV